MNSECPTTQGENLSWALICVADALDELRADHAFLTTLYAIARDNPSSMDDDLLHLLTAYMDSEPRQKLQQASDDLMAVARKLPRQSE